MNKITQAINLTRFRLNMMKDLKRQDGMTYETQGGDDEVAFLEIVLAALTEKRQQTDTACSKPRRNYKFDQRVLGKKEFNDG